MRTRQSVLLVAIGALLLAAGACAAPTSGTTTTTTSTTTTSTTTTTTTPGTWLAAGCIDGTGSDGAAAPDLKFNGTPNQLNNATFSALLGGENVFTISGNGTCSGQVVGAITIVRAPDLTSASAVCDGLGAGSAISFAGTAWTLPADAYSCSLTTTF